MSWLFLLAAWVLAAVVAAAAYAAWNHSGLDLAIALRSTVPGPASPADELPDQLLRTAPPPGPVFEGDAVEVQVTLTTKGAARGPAWLTGCIGDEQVSAASAVIPRAGWSHVEVVERVRRGPVDATSWLLSTGDPFGFFVARRRCPDTEVALVLPRFASLRGRFEVHELETTLAAPRAGSGNELFGVREFRPGDPLRRIHWRSTARRGELVVREFEPPGGQTLAILCGRASTDQDAADQVARIAASEAFDCITGGGRAFLWSPGVEPTGHSESRDLWALLAWLARYRRTAGGLDSPPPVASEVVAILTAPDPDVVDALDDIRRRGSRARAWIVGGAHVEIDAAIPTRAAGTAWPL